MPEPRGVAHVHAYRGSGGSWRRLYVCTPTGYEKRRRPWPVLYLLHGSSDSDRDWLELGQAGEILDRMVAAKRDKPMLLVMSDGHPHLSLDVSTRTNNLEALATDLRGLMMLLVAKHNGASRRPSPRAIAGASMRGVQALQLAALQPADSDAVAGFNAPGEAPSGPKVCQAWSSATGNRAGPRFWLACGQEHEFLPNAEEVAGHLRACSGSAHCALRMPPQVRLPVFSVCPHRCDLPWVDQWPCLVKDAAGRWPHQRTSPARGSRSRTDPRSEPVAATRR